MYGLPNYFQGMFTQSALPVALFSAPNHICPGTCTSFNNLSLNATSYLWSFPGANQFEGFEFGKEGLGLGGIDGEGVDCDQAVLAD